MRTKFSKLLSILLCLVMVVGLLPTVVLAAEGDPVAQYTDIGTYATAVSEVKSAENAFVSVSGNIYRDGTKLSNSKIDNETYSITAIQYRDSGSSNEYSNVPEAWVSNKSDKYGSFYFVISQIPVGSYDIQITFDFTGTYNNGTRDTSDDENISVTGMAANTTLDVLPDVAVSSDPFVLEVSDVTASYADIGQTYLPIPFKAMCGTYDVSGVVEVRWELVEGVTMSDSDPDKQSDGSYTFRHLYPFANGICGTVQLKVWAVYGHYNYDQSYELIVDKTTKPATINVTMTDCDKMFAAQIGSTGYTTLAAAITAANSGDTVTLLKDVTESVTIAAEKNITLDLNGKTLTNTNGQHTITNSGTLTIVDSSANHSGTVDNVTHAKAAVYNNVGGSVTLSGGAYNRSQENGISATDNGGNSYYTLVNRGTMVVNGEYVAVSQGEDRDGRYSSLVENGWQNGWNDQGYTNNPKPDDVSDPTLTISAGTFIGGLNTIKNDDFGVLTITGGTFKNSAQNTVLNANQAEISGGNFSGDQNVIYNYSYSTEPNVCKVTITGGTFSGSIVGGYVMTVTGGTFSTNPTDYVADGYIAQRSGSEGSYTYTVIAKNNLTSGVYMSDPTDYTAANHYVTKNNDGTWTVFYVAPYVAPTYSITVDSAKHGDVTVSPKNASKGDKVTVTVESDKGYTLETLTVTDKNGDEIELTNKGDGKYTFTMPAGKVYVEATFMEDNSMLNFFVDVFPGDYYYDAVLWAVKNGITGGVDAAHFAPNATCTRAQVVTFLWRAAGSPAPKSSMIPFTDVPAGSYYETAVLWAAENGITGGTGNNAFSPDAACTRGQIVSFLWRALGSPAAGTVNPFADVAADAYYNTAVLWAAENGITGGTGNNAFSPDADCTRAQIVTFLYRSAT